jgi:hypothetical protein
MNEILELIFRSPIANLLIIVGLMFLGIAVIGSISGKTQPGIAGYLLSGLPGLSSLRGDLIMYWAAAPGTYTSISSTNNSTASSTSARVEIDVFPPTFVYLGFHIIKTCLRADPLDYMGARPIMIPFSGRISLSSSQRRSDRFV